MTNFKLIVGNFRDILGKLRDKLYTQMPNGRVKGSHISMYIHIHSRAIPFRGIDSTEREREL